MNSLNSYVIITRSNLAHTKLKTKLDFHIMADDTTATRLLYTRK